MYRNSNRSKTTSPTGRSEEHTSELQSHRDLHSFPTRRSSDLDLRAQDLRVEREVARDVPARHVQELEPVEDDVAHGCKGCTVLHSRGYSRAIQTSTGHPGQCMHGAGEAG